MSIGNKFIRLAFLALWITSLVASLCMQGVAADAPMLPAKAEDISPLQAGDRAPAFTLRTIDDEPYIFDPAGLDRPTVLISFRGGWCPYCNMHLSELRHVIPEIRKSGFDVLFLSNDRPEMLFASLKNETQEDIEGLDYVILSDADITAARALGTAFTVSERLVESRNEKGQDIRGSSIDKYRALAVPAVFVVDRSGKITFAYANPDYSVRLSADALREATEDLLSR
jgi:peroxiredoxin